VCPLSLQDGPPLLYSAVRLLSAYDESVIPDAFMFICDVNGIPSARTVRGAVGSVVVCGWVVWVWGSAAIKYVGVALCSVWVWQCGWPCSSWMKYIV
jgi:hypothetical protein